MNIQNLTNELVNGYTKSKYDESYLKEKINEILEFILPYIAKIIKNKKEREPVKLWDSIKDNIEVENLFRKTLEIAERPIVIYVTSKFKNNKYFGTKIIEEALKLKESQKWK